MNIRELLIGHEGLRYFPYFDTEGKLTIGIGHNLNARGLTKEAIDLIFEEDLKETVDELYERLPWFNDQPEKVKLVIVDMAFNLGVSGLLGFHKTLEFIRTGKYKKASVEMLDSTWAKQVGTRADDLSNILKSI